MFNVILSFVLLMLGMWLLYGIAVLLHAGRDRYGLSLLLMYTTAMVSILTYVNNVNIFIEPLPQLILTIPADLFIPTVLLVILMLYVLDGTLITQLVIFSIALVQLLITLVAVLVSSYSNLPVPITSQIPFNFTELLGVNLQLMFAGVIAFAVDMFVVAVVYQGVLNRLRGRWQGIAIVAALLSANWTDAIVFNLLSSIGRGGFFEFLPGDLISKTFGALVLAPIAIVYIYSPWAKLTQNTEIPYRPSFDIFHNIFGSLRLKLIRLEVELRQTELNSRELIGHIEEIFWMANAGDNSAYFLSPAFERIVGMERGEYYQSPQTIQQLIHPDNRTQVEGRWLAFQPNTHDLEFQIVRADGTICWLRDRTYIVEQSDLGVYRVVGITEDITVQKNAQDLQRQIAIEREKIRFLYNLVQELSHDIQSPLVAINLKVDLLERVKHDAQRQGRYLDELRRQTLNLSELVNHLFTLLKVESQTTETYIVQPFNDMCREVCGEQIGVAEQKQIHFETHFTSDSTIVHGHPTELRRAIMNLVSNAIRYTPPGGKIRVETRIDSESGQVILTVQDSGIGIAADDLPYIFDRFFRAKNTAGIDGTGLGLAITQRIAQQHRGNIEVTSQIGQGSTFMLRLPLAGSPVH